MTWKWAVRVTTLVIVGLIVIGAVKNPFHHKKGPTAMGPSAVAAIIGADYCADSGYLVQSRLDGSEQTIYDCTTGIKSRCVTMNGGIASDSTQEVRFLFANALGGAQPACLTNP